MKKISYLLLLPALLMFLTACGQSAKETYTEAYQNLVDANSYELTSVVDLNLETEDVQNIPELQMILNIINNAEITVDSIVDMEKEISETIFHVKTSQGPMSFDLDIPVHLNNKEQKVYIKTETIEQALQMFPVMPLPQGFTFDKKFVELDATPQIDTQEQKEIESQVKQKFSEMLTDLPKDSFESNGDVISLNIEGEQLNTIVLSFVEFIMEQNGELLQQGNKQELEKALDKVEFNNLQVESTIKKGNITNEKITFGLTAGEAEEKVDISFDLDTEYRNINGNVEFTMEPSEDNVITQKELEEQMNEMMMEMMMQPPAGR